MRLKTSSDALQCDGARKRINVSIDTPTLLTKRSDIFRGVEGDRTISRSGLESAAAADLSVASQFCNGGIERDKTRVNLTDTALQHYSITGL